MSGIRIDSNFTDSTLPTGTSLAAAVLANTNTRNWYQADALSTTLNSGNIQTWNSRKSGSTNTFNQATTTAQAALTAGAIGAYSAAVFNAANFDQYAHTGTAQDLTLPFTWCAVFKPTSAANTALLSSFTSSTVRAILVHSAANTMAFQYGTSTINVPVTDGAWNALIVGYDGTYLRASINGAEITHVAAAGSPGTATFRLGSLDGSNNSWCWPGSVSDILTFNNCVLDDATNLANLRAWMLAAYGIQP